MAKRVLQPASLATNTQVEKETIPWVKLFMNAGSRIREELGTQSFLFTENFLSNSHTHAKTPHAKTHTHTHVYTDIRTCRHADTHAPLKS